MRPNLRIMTTTAPDAEVFRRRFLLSLVATGTAPLLMGFRSFESLLAPDADLWPRWQAEDSANPARIDFAAWDVFLQRYVRPGPDGINRVAYAEVTVADRAALNDFIVALQSVEVTRLSRAAQLPYWINLYNAVTVKLILNHYPVETIRDIDISGGLFSDGPWDAKLIMVEGEMLTLNDVEHRVLRPIWRDPRIHYAVNCASLGCPNLDPTAFRAEGIGERLDAAAYAYVNHPRGISISSGGKVTVSKIYDWFYADFGGTDEGVLEHLTAYAEPELARRLVEIGALHGTAYDWSLNGT